MMKTATQSAALKTRFRDFWAAEGYDAPLPPDLRLLANQYPDEYGEACDEYESDPNW